MQIEYSPENLAKLAAQYINTTHRHVFLTGKAGTGKTTFLKYIRKHTHKQVVVAAPTGIAAINAEGSTLHSLFQLPFGAYVPGEIAPHHAPQILYKTPRTLMKDFRMQSKKRQMIRNIELLIIDEVSMLRADMLDAINHVLQSIRHNRRPFGGVQLLLIGDMLQLPPVVKEQEWEILKQFYPSAYFFDAKAFSNNQPIYIELDKIYRQTNQEFIDILNNLRHNKLTSNDLKTLNKKYFPDFEPEAHENYITLTTHNYKADHQNSQKLRALATKQFDYRAEIQGTFPENLYPIEYELHLKEGAQIMFIKNDPSGKGQFYNGKLGVVFELTPTTIWVRFGEKDEPIEVEKYSWENKRYTLNTDTNEIEEEFLGAFKHFPIKLAWAITIHKSQGLTFEKAIIDIGDVFAPGQAYVALSRLTSLEGLVLKSRFSINNLDPDYALTLFSQSKTDNKELQEQLELEKRNYTVDFVSEAFDFEGIRQALENHIYTYNKEANRSQKQVHKPWAEALKKDFDELVVVAEKFRKQIHRIIRQHQQFEAILLERLEASNSYFTPRIEAIQTKVEEQIKLISLQKGTKKYQNELRELDANFIGLLQRSMKAVAIVKSLKDNSELEKKDWAVKQSDLSKELETKAPAPHKAAKKAQQEKENTLEKTFALFSLGKTAEQIAAERNLAQSTIESHLAKLVEIGKVKAQTLISDEWFQVISDVLMEQEDDFTLTEIKNQLPDEITYSAIRIVKAHYIFSANNTPLPKKASI